MNDIIYKGKSLIKQTEKKERTESMNKYNHVKECKYISQYYHSNKIEQILLQIAYTLIIGFNRVIIGALLLGSIALIIFTGYKVFTTFTLTEYFWLTIAGGINFVALSKLHTKI